MNDLPVGRSVDETLRLVQAFQYTDKHGEGACHLNILVFDTCAKLHGNPEFRFIMLQRFAVLKF